ncbi:MAG TPA: AP2 domain-containing protein [Polyangiaceae bacterium]|jgi:hypothetical protein|nr:AP2 domain-containing protein [Polyangiaceae bacterium]
MAPAKKATRKRIYGATLKVRGVVHLLARWPTRKDAQIARDRAILHFGLDLPLSFPREARRLGPLSPEGIRALVRSQVRATRHSRYAGVYWNERRHTWQAQIAVDGRAVSLGVYPRDEEEAAGMAVDQAARFLGRKPPNFPDRKLGPKSPTDLRAERRVLRGTSKYFGVTRRPHDSRPWFFQLNVPGGAHVAIGGYRSDKLAALAHDRALLHYGIDLPINFPAKAKSLGPADIETLREEVNAVRKKGCTSKYHGVHWVRSRKRWVVTMRVEGQHRYIGEFKDEEEAARAFDKAAKRLLKSAVRRLNFP